MTTLSRTPASFSRLTAVFSADRETQAIAIQTALAVLLFALPYLAGGLANGGHYTPFSIGSRVSDLVYDETFEYAAQVSAWLRRGTLRMESVAELMPGKGIYPPLPIVLTSAVARLTGSLDTAWIALHLLCPALLWCLVFRLLRRFDDDWLACSALTWFVMLVPFGPRNALLLGRFSLGKPIDYARFPDPCLTFLFLLGALWAAARARSLRSAVVAGIAGGMLFYSYYFFWILFLGAIGLHLCAAAVGRRPRRAIGWWVTATTAIATGAPYLWITHRAQPAMRLLMARMGSFQRQPDLFGLALAIAALAALGVRYRRNSSESDRAELAAMGLATLGAVGIGLNFQLLSGYNAQHQKHFFNMAFQPFAAMALAIAFLAYARGSRLRRGLSSAAIGLIALTAFREIACGVRTAPDHRSDAPLLKALRWARDSTEGAEVIASSAAQAIPLIPAIAGNPGFVPVSARTSATAPDMMTRFAVTGYLEGKDLAELRDQLFAVSPAFSDRPWLSVGYLLWGAGAFNPDADLRGLLDSAWAALNLPQALASRRLDLLLLPRTADLRRLRQHFRGIEFAYQNAEWELLRLSGVY